MNENITSKEKNELAELARRIYDWANKSGLPLARVIRDYPGLGSDRTWRDLRENNLDGYDIDSQLNNYRAAWNVIEEVSGSSGQETLFDNLNPVLMLRQAALQAMKTNGTNRVVILQAPSGCGKTTALRMLCGKYGQRIVRVEASDAWSDKPSALLGAILRALGLTELPGSPTERLEKCQDLLNISRRCVAIDEAHHLGQHSLNTIKTLVNTTPGEFILVAIPTLWAKLETKSFQEARQLSTNRLSERVRIELTEKDIERYLAHCFEGTDSAVLKYGAKLIRPAAVCSGNLAFVRDVAVLLRASGASPLTAKDFSDAIASVASKR